MRDLKPLPRLLCFRRAASSGLAPSVWGEWRGRPGGSLKEKVQRKKAILWCSYIKDRHFERMIRGTDPAAFERITNGVTEVTLKKCLWSCDRFLYWFLRGYYRYFFGGIFWEASFSKIFPEFLMGFLRRSWEWKYIVSSKYIDPSLVLIHVTSDHR